MTIREAIAQLESMKPHQFTPMQVCKWLEELDRRVFLEVMLFVHTTAREIRYDYPECEDYELLLEAPHDSVYFYWLASKVDFANGETDKAANSIEMFNSHWDSYVAWFLNTYRPGAGYSLREPVRHFR